MPAEPCKGRSRAVITGGAPTGAIAHALHVGEVDEPGKGRDQRGQNQSGAAPPTCRPCAFRADLAAVGPPTSQRHPCGRGHPVGSSNDVPKVGRDDARGRPLAPTTEHWRGIGTDFGEVGATRKRKFFSQFTKFRFPPRGQRASYVPEVRTRSVIPGNIITDDHAPSQAFRLRYRSRPTRWGGTEGSFRKSANKSATIRLALVMERLTSKWRYMWAKRKLSQFCDVRAHRVREIDNGVRRLANVIGVRGIELREAGSGLGQNVVDPQGDQPRGSIRE